jgi:Type IV secretion system pilin
MSKFITHLILAFAILTALFAPFAQAQTLQNFNPLGNSGIKCIYYYKGSTDNPAGCNQNTGLFNRVEWLLLLLAPALAVVGVMIGGYKIMQDGYEAKGEGMKLIKGSLVGLVIVLSAFFVRDLVYTVLNGTFNTSGNTANSINNAGVKAIVNIAKTIAYEFLVPFGTPFAVGMLIWGGFQIMTAGGDSKKVSQGTNTVKYAIVGFLVIVFAALIVSLSQTVLSGIFKEVIR